MKKLAFLVVLSILSFNSYSQIKFEKGYFITNDDKKTECLIKNVDWGRNPTQFEYKMNENSELKSESTASVKEFGLHGFSTYKRFKVKIDSSLSVTSQLGYQREPEFGEEETLFLNQLLKGKATLYTYVGAGGNLKRFFYTLDGSSLKQLVYKRYLKTSETGDQIVENNAYKQELWRGLECEKLTIEDAENLSYKKNTLIKYFIKYNQCKGSNLVRRRGVKRKVFNVSLRAGLAYSSVSVENKALDDEYSKVDFEGKISPRIDLEIEYMLPFSKNKWALLLEPNYLKYEAQEKRNSGGVPLLVDVNYKGIELPLGIRYYFLNKGKSRLFVNASYVINIPLEDSELIFTNADTNNIGNQLDMEKNSRSIAFGLGYSFNNRISFETRHHLKNDLLPQFLTWRAYYNTTSFILGLRIL